MWKRLGLLGILLGWVPGLGATVQIDGIAAYVNAHVITISDVLGASARLQETLREGTAGESANALYQEVLTDLIDRKLILDAYEQQREIQIPPMLIDQRVQEVIEEAFRGDRNAFLRALGEDGRSERSWREEIREQVVVRAMRNLRVDRLVRVSPTAIRAYYEAHPEEFRQAGSVTYRMLVVPAGATVEGGGTMADAVAAALQAGEPFEAVVQRYSTDAFASQGGLRGPVAPEQLREELRSALAGLGVDEVAGPVVLGSNLIWLQGVASQPAREQSFVEAYDEIERILSRKRAEALYADWLARLRADAFVRVTTENPF